MYRCRCVGEGLGMGMGEGVGIGVGVVDSIILGMGIVVRPILRMWAWANPSN